MSGGSHNYICYRIEDELCGQMHDRELNDLIKDIAELAHDLEWYDSCDKDEEEYRASIEKFKAKWFKGDRAERLRGYVTEAVDELRNELYKLVGGATEDPVDLEMR